MKTLKSILPRAALIFLIFTILCGVLYTGVVTGIAQLIFPEQANGSIIEVDGKNTAPRCSASNTQMKRTCGGVL